MATPLFDPNALNLDPAKFPGVDPSIVGRAGNLMGAKYTGTMGQLGRNQQILEEGKITDIDKLTKYGEYGTQAIGGITQQLHDQLRQGVMDLQGIFDNGVNLVQQPYAAAGQQMSDYMSQVGQYVQGLDQSLGTGDLFSSRSAPVQALRAGEQLGLQTLGANRAANLGEYGTQMTGLAQMGVAFADQAGAQRQTDLLNTIAGAVADVTHDYNLQSFDVIGQAADLMAELGFDTANIIDDLIERTEATNYQRQQDEFSRNMQLGQIGIGPYAGHFAAANQAKVDPIKELITNLGYSEKLTEAGYGSDVLSKLGLPGYNPPKKPTKYEGRSGLQQWAKDQQVPSTYLTAATDLVENAVADAGGDTGNAYNIAMSDLRNIARGQTINGMFASGGNVITQSDKTGGSLGQAFGVPLDWLTQAIDIYFGKY